MADDWQKTSIGQLADLVKRGRAPVYVEEGTPVFNQRCIRDGRLDLSPLRYTDEQAKSLPDWVVLQPGDVLINSTGRGTLGRAALFTGSPERASADSHVTIVRPTPGAVDPGYLVVYLQMRKVDLEALATGSTDQTELAPGSIASFPVMLPPPEVQRRIGDLALAIAEVVERANTAAEATRKLLAARRHALIVPNGTDWSALPDGWRLSHLSALADVRSGITKGRKTKGELAPRPYLRAANVQDGSLDLREVHEFLVTASEIERSSCREDDVLLIEGGNKEDVGRGWIWDGQVEGCLHQNHVFRARIFDTDADPRFVAYAIATAPARAYCLGRAKQTNNLASLNKTEVSGLPVPLPPPEVQRAIVGDLDALNTVLAGYEDVAARAAALQAGLLPRIASGEVEIGDGYDRFLDDVGDLILAAAG